LRILLNLMEVTMTFLLNFLVEVIGILLRRLTTDPKH
jgi:hypothetical protein